nr:prolipoprotein diacylglyceryl transferase [Planctomycetota bacterium]
MADPSLLIAPGSEHCFVDALSPFALYFGNGIGIRWYGLAYLLGLAWGFWMAWRWSGAGRSPLSRPQIQDFVLAAGLGMLICGRLGFCLFYAWPDVVDNPIGRMGLYDRTYGDYLPTGAVPRPDHEVVRRFEFPFILQVWNGGMASHGGLAGLVIGSWWYARRQRMQLPVLLDMVSATAPMGVACGRIANFINGELWGRPSDAPWAVIFPHAPTVGGFHVGRHPSQLYAAFLEGFIILAIVLPLHARHRRPGLTTGVVFCLYAIGRFVGEHFREPDIGQPGSPGHAAILGFMSKGQALTIPVFVVGLVILIWALRR